MQGDGEGDRWREAGARAGTRAGKVEDEVRQLAVLAPKSVNRCLVIVTSVGR